MENIDRFIELKQQGYYCSQILLLMGLENQGKSNPDLVRAVEGLAGGIGFSGEVCGALSAGACLLGLYAGKGLPDEEEDLRLNLMILDLVDWFKKEIGEQYGGIRCADIVEAPQRQKMPRCAGIVAQTYQKVNDLLVENGFELSGNLDER
jgi:C_GCAxxG_C_C family probable redox protein